MWGGTLGGEGSHSSALLVGQADVVGAAVFLHLSLFLSVFFLYISLSVNSFSLFISLSLCLFLHLYYLCLFLFPTEETSTWLQHRGLATGVGSGALAQGPVRSLPSSHIHLLDQQVSVQGPKHIRAGLAR